MSAGRPTQHEGDNAGRGAATVQTTRDSQIRGIPLCVVPRTTWCWDEWQIGVCPARQCGAKDQVSAVADNTLNLRQGQPNICISRGKPLILLRGMISLRACRKTCVVPRSKNSWLDCNNIARLRDASERPQKRHPGRGAPGMEVIRDAGRSKCRSRADPRSLSKISVQDLCPRSLSKISVL